MLVDAAMRQKLVELLKYYDKFFCFFFCFSLSCLLPSSPKRQNIEIEFLFEVVELQTEPQREIFPRGTKIDIGPPPKKICRFFAQI